MSIARDISRQTRRSIVEVTSGNAGTNFTVSGGFSGSSLDVYLNGAKLIINSDYSLNGTSGIILNQAAVAGDIIEFVSRNTSNVLNVIDTSSIVDEAVTFDKLSDSATESSNVQKRVAKAWLSYIGSTQTIESDFNISSVSWNSAGDYTINFENSMNNGNYAFATHGADTNNNTTIHTWGQGQNFSKSATSIRLQHYLNGGGGYDSFFGVCVIIFGD